MKFQVNKPFRFSSPLSSSAVAGGISFSVAHNLIALGGLDEPEGRPSARPQRSARRALSGWF